MSITSKPGTRSITLKKGEKFFLNGALFRVNGPVKVDICTTDSVLLPYHILEEKHAHTPLHKLYYYVQKIIIDQKNTDKWLTAASDTLETLQLDTSYNPAASAIKLSEQGNAFEALLDIRNIIKSRYGSFSNRATKSPH